MEPQSSASPRSVALLGAGPSGLMAAHTLAQAGMKVHVYERMPSVGRKFLMAGRGGLNLTHSEDFRIFLTRYGDVSPDFKRAIQSFRPEDVVSFAEGLDQGTFVGSSGRIFPRRMKASPLLRAWLKHLDALGVVFHLRHDWQGWDGDALVFETPTGRITSQPDAVMLALGGASWPRLGADGSWVPVLSGLGTDITPLTASNCGVLCDWSDTLRDRFAGEPIKRATFSIGDKTVPGEAVVTRLGLEGGAIYALSHALRDAVAAGNATLICDLRPDMSSVELGSRMAQARKSDSVSNRLRKAAGLSPVAIALLHEHALRNGFKLADSSARALTGFIKALELPVIGMAGLDRAISSAGGVKHTELDENFMLKRKPGVFVAGEMLDWDAPTGGYLLQACFSTGVAAARGMQGWLNR